MSRRSPLSTPLRTVQAAILLGILGLIGYSFMESRAAGGSPTLQTESPSPAVKAMQSNVGVVALDLLSYLGDQDVDHLNGVKIAGKEIKHLLGAYRDSAVSLNTADELDRRYEALRAATVALLEADGAEKEHRAGLARTSKLLSDVFDKIRPTLRANQLSAYARLQAVAQAEVEARALASQTADSGRFEKSMGAYEDFTRTRAGRSTSDQAEGLFSQGQSQSREIQKAIERKTEALKQFSEAYRRFGDALEMASRPIGDAAPATQAAAPVILLPSLRGWVAGMLFTLLFIFVIDRFAIKRMLQPMNALIQAAEAAATGDLSRTNDTVAHDEVGRLSSAVHRLIAVLSRSENLVYHLAALVEASGDAIIGQSLDGTILSWNKGAQRIYGYSADEVKGRSILMLAPEHGEELKGMIQRIKRGERPAPFDMLHQAKNGRRVKAFVRAGAILDSTRQVIGVSMCAQEIPEAADISAAAAHVDVPLPQVNNRF